MLTADDVVRILKLETLPFEGGAFREMYRSALRISTSNTDDGEVATSRGSEKSERHASTQIYYLLRRGESSALHRVRSDEVFHHYLGDPVVQLQIDDSSETFADQGPQISAETKAIGSDLASGQRPQVLAPKHIWQGALLADVADGAGFALLGCTVAPGFEWEDFELITPDRALQLAKSLPEHRKLIEAMTPVAGRTRA